jgi:hypothetical protein
MKYPSARQAEPRRIRNIKAARATDAKEVGVGNPAEETYCYPNLRKAKASSGILSTVIRDFVLWGARFDLLVSPP